MGPNSGPDWRESVGWKILLPLTGAASSGEGLRGVLRPGRKGRDSGPCISSRWGLWTFEGPRLEMCIRDREHVDRAIDRPIDIVVDQVFEFVVPALVDRAMQRA